jgi:dTDP-4-dehydrorhamnose reductase
MLISDMRVLLTGGSGQVGHALQARLTLQARLKDIEILAPARSQFDLRAPSRLPGLLAELNPGLIINAGAYTAVDRAEEDQEAAHAINAIAPGVLARWAAKREVPIIHFSTDYVFDGSGSVPWKENDETGPLSVYGRSKLAGEQAIAASGACSLIIRTCWVYAATGKNFMRTVARLAVERDTLKIVSDQIGTPTTAGLIADCVVSMLKGSLGEFKARTAAAHGLVHLAASGETSWFGFATAIVDGLRERGVSLKATEIVPIATTEYPTPAKRPLNSRLDLQRLRAVFGISPAHWSDVLEAELDAVASELKR